MTSHVVIVARAMGIPVVGQVSGIVSMTENGDPIIIDGDDGNVHLRPMADLESAYAEKVRFSARRQEQFRALRAVEPGHQGRRTDHTADECRLLVDLPQLEESGASGVGLFRTELQFMIASTLPKVEEQEQFYRSALKQADGKAGDLSGTGYRRRQGDPLCFALQTRKNPALGLARHAAGPGPPGILRMQLRALLRATADRELRLMFPMVTEISEAADRAFALSTGRLAIFRASDTTFPARSKSCDAGGSQPDVATRRADERGGFRFRRLQRPVPVHDGFRSSGNARVSNRFESARGRTFLRILRQRSSRRPM